MVVLACVQTGPNLEMQSFLVLQTDILQIVNRTFRNRISLVWSAVDNSTDRANIEINTIFKHQMSSSSTQTAGMTVQDTNIDSKSSSGTDSKHKSNKPVLTTSRLQLDLEQGVCTLLVALISGRNSADRSVDQKMTSLIRCVRMWLFCVYCE